MVTEFFKGCNTINEVKQRYQKLAKQYHPDISGYDSTAEMQRINDEYAKSIKSAAQNFRFKGNDAPLNEEQVEAEILNAEEYRIVIEKIITLPDIEIEVCGGWIWVGGDTKKYAKQLGRNGAGLTYASKKQMWFFRNIRYATPNRCSVPMDVIRETYGSVKISNKPFKTVEEV